MSFLSSIGRTQVLELAARHSVTPAQFQDLLALAGLDGPPARLGPRSVRVATVLAAALFGFGVLLWLAANWSVIPRAGKFGLLQGLLAAACLGAWLKPAARTALLLLAFFVIGGLFAFFGQTYQTGTDPWQLFALWAVLALPLAWAARSDVLWSPWMLVVMSAVSLWIHANTGWHWRVDADTVRAHYIGWGCAALLIGVAGPWSPIARAGGIGMWALRTAALLTCLIMLSVSLPSLFSEQTVLAYYVALLICGAAFTWLWRSAVSDVFLLSAIALTGDILILCGIVKVFFDWRHAEAVSSFFTVGILSAAVVGLTVWAVMAKVRRDVNAEAAQ